VTDRDPEMLKRAEAAYAAYKDDDSDLREIEHRLHDFAAAEVERALAAQPKATALDERQARLERFACAAMGPCVTTWCEGGQTLDDCVDTAMQVAKAMLAESDRIREEWEKA
jgi:hypothetical protein